MKTGYIWYNCLIKELNLEDNIKNVDSYSLSPARQDLFYILAKKHEVMTQLLPKVKDQRHRSLILEAGQQREDFSFFISRDLCYIQFIYYFVFNIHASLWQKFSEITFDDINKLQCLHEKTKHKSYDPIYHGA